MFGKSTWEIFVPDHMETMKALERTTYMAVAAHQDDVEIMACDGIMQCFGKKEQWFCALVVTDGAGSSRRGRYLEYSDEEMKSIRRKEQKKAAVLGEYGALVLLDYESQEVKHAAKREVMEDIKLAIKLTKPEVLYTHNLMDKHDTHVATAIRLIEALREMPKEVRPKKLYGCEVWRSLDWLQDDEKVYFDLTERQNITSALIGLYDSQISGGKRYDLATLGRWRANATYSKSHLGDSTEAISYALNMTPLIEDDSLDIEEFCVSFVRRLELDIASKINKFRK